MILNEQQLAAEQEAFEGYMQYKNMPITKAAPDFSPCIYQFHIVQTAWNAWLARARLAENAYSDPPISGINL